MWEASKAGKTPDKSPTKQPNPAANTKELGVKSIKLITNNPYKIEKLRALGVVVNGCVASHIPPNEQNIGYLRDKRDFMSHRLNHLDTSEDDNIETTNESSRRESPSEI